MPDDSSCIIMQWMICLPVLHYFSLGDVLPELREIRPPSAVARLHLSSHDQEAVLRRVQGASRANQGRDNYINN